MKVTRLQMKRLTRIYNTDRGAKKKLLTTKSTNRPEKTESTNRPERKMTKDNNRKILMTKSTAKKMTDNQGKRITTKGNKRKTLTTKIINNSNKNKNRCIWDKNQQERTTDATNTDTRLQRTRLITTTIDMSMHCQKQRLPTKSDKLDKQKRGQERTANNKHRQMTKDNNNKGQEQQQKSTLGQRAVPKDKTDDR